MALPSPQVGDPLAQLNFELIAQYFIVGDGSPEGKVKAPIGALFINRAGTPGSTHFVKESGGNSETGWTAALRFGG